MSKFKPMLIVICQLFDVRILAEHWLVPTEKIVLQSASPIIDAHWLLCVDTIDEVLHRCCLYWNALDPESIPSNANPNRKHSR